ncbi:LOW QUALITY PROTEIN: protein COFACTOR ASSEMBLY OF COMPLEX C SUBUNIT B CCB3, chloroplastic-like [Pyrus x bretschneideri]|uniref:LOW QUALITY PROTEIN: protein COFACTOR ASSEMBLY OF COMPLEX C SUBUNIT B CCB3, chloroplastic-like n=1 Tax=Pyrus x bretschneideri TaxID=225117 RepID=UPI00202FB91B|nr:LOW QUALITY PROTEIN: protein COFACTOR ASSEMBLY OF COMPLEX C SUBUNIT B CCB3, chloroplastic-like [Pyrus x bretschneideri]
MATCSYLLNHVQIKGWPSTRRISKLGNLNPIESFKTRSKRQPRQGLLIAQCSFCLVQVGAASPTALLSLKPFDDIDAVSNIFRIDPPSTPHNVSNLMHNLVVADLDPATAKLAIGFLGPFFSLFSFLFIIRIVMSWYPKLPVGKFPYVVAYAPTEPILMATRKVIPPLGGVDVTPVVWFGLISFLNEILVGPQGLLVLLSQQLSS